jgi:hypothetical protein
VDDNQLKVKIRYHANQISAMPDLKAKEHLTHSVSAEHKDLLILQLVEDIRTLNETLNIADKVLAGYKQMVDELMRDAPTHAKLNQFQADLTQKIADLPNVIVGDLAHAKTAKKLASEKSLKTRQAKAIERESKLLTWLKEQPMWKVRSAKSLAEEAATKEFGVKTQQLTKDIKNLQSAQQ